MRLPEGSFAAKGAMGKYLIVIPARELVVAHIQLKEWPDNASVLPKSQLPGPESSVDGRKMGKLLSIGNGVRSRPTSDGDSR